MSAITNITYSDMKSQLMLWQKSLLLTPLWVIPLIPIYGLICRTAGKDFVAFGYSLMLGILVMYFLMDVLKRRIRLDEKHIYHGLNVLAIKDLESIDVIYQKANFLPAALRLTTFSGKTMQLSLSRLKGESVERLFKHLKKHNPSLQTPLLLNTLVNFKTNKQLVLRTDNARMAIPYQSRQLLSESIDTFKISAASWLRSGPVIVALGAAGTIWVGFIGFLFGMLDPVHLATQSMILNHAAAEISRGLLFYLACVGTEISTQTMNVAKISLVSWFTGTAVIFVLVQLIRTLLRPNLLIADEKGMVLSLSAGNFSLPLSRVSWDEVETVDLTKRKGSELVSLRKKNGKHFALKLPALPEEYRKLFLRKLESSIPECTINHELSQKLLPKAKGSYTEIWLQSLNQPLERKTLDPLQPGQVVDERFEILKSLGVGGQGSAYLCRSLLSQDKETIVLKETIIPVFVDEMVHRRALERFEHEAKLLQALESDRIVRLLDYFVEDHRAYLVLEHIDGFSLRNLIAEKGPVTVEQAQDLALQMCTILKFLHASNVIHRDFTPDNLILNSKGVLKLIDFNVAQQIQSGTTGTIVGKHAYLPPEQFRGKATHRSDIYAFGATLYFLLVGEDPEPISQSSPLAKNSETGEMLDRVVKKATALNESERYQNAQEIELQLVTIANDTDQLKQIPSSEVVEANG